MEPQIHSFSLQNVQIGLGRVGLFAGNNFVIKEGLRRERGRKEKKNFFLE